MERDKLKCGEGKTTPIAEVAASSHSQSIPSTISSRSEDSDQPKRINGARASPSSSNKDANAVTRNVNNAKSCKGCLYYSSRFKADSRNPVCVGLTRSLPNVPRYIAGQSETGASKEDRSFTDFRYACVGYSLFVDQKEQGSNGQKNPTVLPVCLGLEVLVDRRNNTADSASAPVTHIQNREDGNRLPQRRSRKPTNSTGDEFFGRFTRNANLVANGVAKNIRRVGNRIKQSLDDVLYPYRRPPK